MTQPLTFRLDRRLPVAVVALHGELTPLSSQVVRKAVMEALAAEPTSVVVDLSGITRVEDVALTVFPALARLAERWPGAPLLLAAAPPAVATALRRMAVAPPLPLHPTVRAAVDVAAKEPVPLRVDLRMKPTVDAPRIARDLAYDICWEWGLPDAATPAKIVSSELVTNAVRHAGTDVDVTFTLHDHFVRVSVRDRASELARMQTPSESDDRGRGLLIVDSLSTAWGNVSFEDGKTVWATVAQRRRPPGQRAGTAAARHRQEV